MLQQLQTQTELADEPFFLPSFFEGETTAWGFFEDPFGRVKRAFTARINGSWDDGEFLLDEHFRFDDGALDHRVWRLSFDQDGSTFSARCADSVGPGRGHHVEGGCYLTYLVRLAVGDRKVVVRFRDLFHQVDADTLLNRAKVTKWGLPVGQLVIAFQRSTALGETARDD
ncbi:MAG: DUF3833 family protein [Pseudomonadota bacterium]